MNEAVRVAVRPWEYLSAGNVAADLGMTTARVLSAAWRGKMPCVWIDDQPYFEEAELERWSKDHKYHPQRTELMPKPGGRPRKPYQRKDGHWAVRLLCEDGLERLFVSGEPSDVRYYRRRKQYPIRSSLRFEVLRRDGFRCRYCGRGAPDVVLHLDHVRSVMDGGHNTLDNLVTACAECNVGKGGESLTPIDLPLPAPSGSLWPGKPTSSMPPPGTPADWRPSPSTGRPPRRCW